LPATQSLTHLPEDHNANLFPHQLRVYPTKYDALYVDCTFNGLSTHKC
jgi:hypothetical protein